MKKKGIKNLMLSMLFGISLLVTSFSVLASDDNIAFDFTVGGFYSNSYTSSRYRQTTNSQNPWKVNLSYSEEGAGTITTFWLDKNGTVVSNTYDVKQGSGAHYYGAYQTASQQDVRLGAENNNYTANTYRACGYWDEETN